MPKPPTLDVVHRDPEELKPDPGNPRTIDEEARDRLRRTLTHFGFVEPLVVNTRTGLLVGGHQRRALAIELGINPVPVVEVDIPPEEAKALAIALNNADAQGRWEPELLSARLSELKAFDVLDLAAFDPAQLKTFGIEPDPDELETEDVSFKATRGRDPETPKLPDEPETGPGDVWHLGDHLVVCADSFALDVVALNGGDEVDTMVTDPPFAIFGSSTGVASDVTDDRMVRPFFAAVARRAALALPEHGHAYVHCDWRSWAALWEGFRTGGLAVRNMLVWDKGGGLGSNYGNGHELIAFAHYVPKASNTFDNRRDSKYRPVYSMNVLRHNRPAGTERLHNAAKPVSLSETLIENSTPEGGTVLDLFAGSGGVLIAAENIGRRAIVVDHDPGWCDVIVNRWRQLTGKKGRRRQGEALEYLDAGEDAAHAAIAEDPAD